MDKKLSKALDKIDHMNDSWFGTESASVEDLPSIQAKQEIIRTSSYLKKSDLDFLKKIAKKTKVPVATLQGDIISEYIKAVKRDS